MTRGNLNSAKDWKIAIKTKPSKNRIFQLFMHPTLGKNNKGSSSHEAQSDLHIIYRKIINFICLNIFCCHLWTP